MGVSRELHYTKRGRLADSHWQPAAQARKRYLCQEEYLGGAQKEMGGDGVLSGMLTDLNNLVTEHSLIIVYVQVDPLNRTGMMST